MERPIDPPLFHALEAPRVHRESTGFGRAVRPRPRGARLAAGVLAVLAAGTPACRKTVPYGPTPVPSDQVVLRVNGEPLSLEEFDNEYRLMAIHYGAVSESAMRDLKYRLADQVLARRLILQEAARLGVTVSREEFEKAWEETLASVPEDFTQMLRTQGVDQEAWKRQVLQQLVVRRYTDREIRRRVRITPDEVREYYWTHLEEFQEPDSVHVRHLLVDSARHLEKARSRLEAGEPFEAVARDLSRGPHRADGGDWGRLPVDHFPPAYLRVLEGLEPGEVSEPVADGFGLHLFQLVERRPARMRPFEEIRDEVYNRLLETEVEHRFAQRLAELKKSARLEVNPELAAVAGISVEERKTQ